jgi:hypothetical protein
MRAGLRGTASTKVQEKLGSYCEHMASVASYKLLRGWCFFWARSAPFDPFVPQSSAEESADELLLIDLFEHKHKAEQKVSDKFVLPALTKLPQASSSEEVLEEPWSWCLHSVAVH